MKTLIGVVILALVVASLVQWGIAWMRQHEFEERLHEVAMKVEERNHNEIKQIVIAEGAKLHVRVATSDVNIRYGPTSDLSYTQRMVSRIATFDNHRATITVDYTQPFLFIPFKRHVATTALIESAAEASRQQGIP